MFQSLPDAPPARYILPPPRGNRVSIRGMGPARDGAKNVLSQLYQRARRGLEINRGEVEGAIRMNQSVHDKEVKEGTVRTRRKLVMPRTPMQKNYVEAIRKNELVFGGSVSVASNE